DLPRPAGPADQRRRRRPRGPGGPDQPAQLGRQGPPARALPAAAGGATGARRPHRPQPPRRHPAGAAVTARAARPAVVLQAASLCLQSPDDAVRATFPLARSAVATLPAGRPRERLTAFLDHALATPPGRLAEHYVEVFDRRRR